MDSQILQISASSAVAWNYKRCSLARGHTHYCCSPD